jgi:purine nucleosidase
MLELAGRGDIPVAAGRENPLITNVEPHWQYTDIKDARRVAKYYGHLPTPIEPSLKQSPLKAHELIIEQVKKHPGEVIIVKEGSLTNLALALLVEPEIAPLVKEVVHMGGGYIPEGVDLTKRMSSSPDVPADAWRYVRKFNTGYDPESSAIVFKSGIPVTFVSGIVTSRVFQYREDLERLRELDTPYHQLLYDAGLGWLDWSIAERKLAGAHMHDPLTLAVVIDRSFCTFQDVHMDIDKFMAGERRWLYKSDKEPQGRVAVDVDKERFEKWLADRLASPLLDS